MKAANLLIIGTFYNSLGAEITTQLFAKSADHIKGEVSTPISKEGSMVDGPKMKCPEVCGANGVPCGAPECYPVCDTMGEEQFVIREFLMFEEGASLPRFMILNKEWKEAVEKGKKLPPGKRPPIEKGKHFFSELDDIIRGPFLQHRGYRDLCRSMEKHPFKVARFDAGTNKYVWKEELHYRWSFRGGMASYLVHENVYEQSKHLDFHRAKNIEISLPVHMMYALAEVLDLTKGHVVIAPGRRPTMNKDGTYTEGAYLFFYNKDFLEKKIGELESLKVISELANRGVGPLRLWQLINSLKKLKWQIDAPERNRKERDEKTNWMFWRNSIVTWLGVGLIFGGLHYWSAKRTEKMMMGGDQVKLEDFTIDLLEEAREDLKESREINEIGGRDKEALEYLRVLDRAEYGNPLFVGEQGVGKDTIVKRAAQLIVLKDPRVPKRLLKPAFKFLYLDPEAFQADTKWRGTQSTRLKLLRKALEGGARVYIEELPDVMGAGTAAGTVSESLERALKRWTTKDWCHVSGSTTPEDYDAMVRRFGRSHVRRFFKIPVGPMAIETVRDIIKPTAKRYAKHSEVVILEEAREAAIELGLKYYRELETERIDAIKQTLQSAIDLAQKEAEEKGQKIEGIEVTRDHVVRVVNTFIERLTAIREMKGGGMARPSWLDLLSRIQRSDWMGGRGVNLSEIVDFIDQITRIEVERHYEVEITRDNIELAARMAEHYYRATTGMPRLDAVETILEDAARLARDRGESAVAAELIIGATEERCGETFDRAEVQEIMKADIDSLMVDVKPGEAVASQPAVDAEAAARTETADRSARLEDVAKGKGAEVAEMMRLFETNDVLKELLKGVDQAHRRRIADELIRARDYVRHADSLHVVDGVRLPHDWEKSVKWMTDNLAYRAAARARQKKAAIKDVKDQLENDPRLDPQLRDSFKELSEEERYRTAGDLQDAWTSLSENERSRIRMKGSVKGLDKRLPPHWIQERLGRSAEGFAAGRGIKAVGRERERPEDRDPKLREEAERKGHERVLDHMFDPKRPKPPGR